MDLNDSRENLFLSQVDLQSIDFLGDELNNSSENLFLSQIDESVLNNEAFLNCDASFDLGLTLEEFINSCTDADEAVDASDDTVRFAGGDDKAVDTKRQHLADTARAPADADELVPNAYQVPSADTERVATDAKQETSADSERFGVPVTDEEIQQLKDSTKNKNTDKNTKWAIRIFDEWRQQRKDSNITDIKIMDKQTMAYWLTRFVIEVRKKNGEEYPSRSLYLVLCGILRHLRDNKVHDKNFLDGKDPDFAELVVVIDSRMKTLLANGLGADVKQADPIGSDQEDKLWDTGVFGSSNAQSLQYTVFYYACKLFGLRGRDEHRNLKCEQFQIGEDRNGKYIRFIGRDSKTFKGGLSHLSLSNKDIKHYCTEGPRCLATFWALYMDALGNTGDFYRRPLSGTTLKYSKQPIGVNKLATFMKDICDKGGLEGNFTNHSGKRTCATSLYNSGIEEQEILGRTGHRSIEAVRRYKRCSDDMRKNVSRVLDPKQPKRPKVDENDNPESSQATCTSGASMPCVKTDKKGNEHNGRGNTAARNPLADMTTSGGTINFSGCTFNF